MALRNAFENVATEGTLVEVRDRLRALGVPAYAAGAAGGTVNVPAGATLLAVSATAVGGDGTFTIDGGDPIMVRQDQGIDFNPAADWIAPAVVFDVALDWVVEWAAAP